MFAVVLFLRFPAGGSRRVPRLCCGWPAIIDSASVVHRGRELVPGALGVFVRDLGPVMEFVLDHLVFR